MKIRSVNGWALGVFAALSLTIAACKGSGGVSGGGKALGAEGYFEAHWEGEGADKSVQVDATRDNSRVDIEFKDSNGNTIQGAGAKGVGPGDTVTVPTGATTITVSGPSTAPSCSGCSGGGGMSEILEDENSSPAFDVQVSLDQVAGNQRQSLGHLQVPVAKWMYVIPLDACVDVNDGSCGPLSNAYASFDFIVASNTTSSQLWNMIEPIMLADVGSQPAVPSNITVNFFSKMVPDRSGAGARFYVADNTAQFESFGFALNSTLTATLTSNSVVYSAPFGWQVIEVAVSATDFSVDGFGGSNNWFHVEADTVEGGVEGFTGSITYW